MEMKLRINEEVNNETLELCFKKIFEEQTEENHLNVVNAINESTYLMPIMVREEDIVNENGELFLSEKAKVQFIGCLNENAEGFMPLFTNSKEALDFISKSVTEDNQKDFEVANLSVNSDMAWSLLLNDVNVCGAVINALSIGWVIRREQLETIED